MAQQTTTGAKSIRIAPCVDVTGTGTTDALKRVSRLTKLREVTGFHTLPGNTGELRNEAGELVDTIFGQDYASTQPGVITWSITGNALIKGFAGYVATIRRMGEPVPKDAVAMKAIAADASRGIIANTVFEISAAADKGAPWDLNATPVFKTGTTTLAANLVESIDYLLGRVTFTSPQTTAPSFTGNIHTVSDLIAGANSFTLTQTTDAIDITDMAITSQNGGFRVMRPGLKTVSLELSGFFVPQKTTGPIEGTVIVQEGQSADITRLINRGQYIVEISPDGGGATIARGYFRITNQSQSGAVGEQEEQSLTMQLNVPDSDDKLVAPFRWFFGLDSTVNPALITAVNAWQDNQLVIANYLHDGVNGIAGESVVADISLSGGLEAMNEFAVTLSGSGEPATWPR